MDGQSGGGPEADEDRSMPRAIKRIPYESAEWLAGVVNGGGRGGFVTEEMGWADYIAEFTPRFAAFVTVPRWR